MNIYHLKYFIDAARLGSVSRSAEENRISHSAVSQAIKSLENYFEVDLIFHAKRRFQLTPEGEMCRIEGEHLLNSLKVTKENLQAERKEVRGQLIIWAPQSIIVDSLYKTLSLYQKKYPKVEINLKPGSASQVRGAVQSGQGSLGLLLDDGDLQNFESTTIKRGNFVLVGKNKNADPQIDGMLVTSKEKIEVRHLLKNYRAKIKAEVPINMEVMSWGVIKNLVEKNFGVGYVPDYCVQAEVNSHRLHILPSPGTAFKFEMKAIWTAKKQLPTNAKLFLDLLKQP